MSNWKEEYNKMSEVNEFFGLPYDEDTDRSIKAFISQLRLQDRDELIKILPEPFVEYDGMKEGYNNCLREVKQLIKDYYNK